MAMLDQTQVMKYMSELDAAQQKKLVDQIDSLDLSVLEAESAEEERGAFEPLFETTLSEINEKREHYKEVGIKAIREGKVGAVLLAGGQVFSLVLTYANVPQMIARGVLGVNPSQTVVLLWVTIFFFITGMFVDTLISVVVVTPIFYGPAMAAGIDPIWLGIIITIQCILGAISPPFGANIFTACAAFNVPYTKVVRGLPPYLIVMIGLSVLLIFFPQIITFYRAFL